MTKLACELKFLNLTLRNFMSFGNNVTVFPLENPGTTFIIGQDLDNTSNGQGGNGVGKAQPLHCKIKTPTGWTTMGEIQVGDLVSTPEGREASVLSTHLQGTRPVYRITFADGRSTEADEDHLWESFSHRWGDPKKRGKKLLTTKQLKPYVDEAHIKHKPWYNIFVPTITPTGQNVSLPIDPYLLGVLLGDGSTKFIPSVYFESSPSQKQLLLAGLLDTDGTVGKTHSISFCTVSEQLASDVQYLVRSLGGKAKITTRNPHYQYKNNKKHGQVAYNVSIQLPNPRSIISLPRKLDKLSPGLTTQYSNAGLRITSVEYIGEKETKCIAIDDPTHLYITDDFIVTHNTTIINALTYAVYDKPVSDISKDNLVNNINKKHMEVVVTFIASDNKTYTIKRARKSKAGAAGNTVFLYKDGEDVTLNSVANTNAEIERIVGIPYELFVRIIVFSASQTPFLDLPLSSPSQANQTDVIEELFGLTELSAKAAVLKEHNKETELQIKIAQVKIDTLNGEHARYQQLIESTKKRIVQWDVQNTSTITQLNKKLNRVVSIDVNEQQNLHNALKDINGALQTAITDQRQLRTRIQQQRQIHDKATVDLTHLHDEKCPYCFQQFADSINKIPETESLIKNSNDTLQTLADELTAMKSVIDKLEFDQAGVKNRITVDDIDEIIQIRSEVDSIRAKIEELTSTVNPYIEPLDELEGANLEKIDYDEINKLKIEVEHQRFLLKLLTKKDSFVRKSLLNKNIPYLNTRLQHYLTNLGLPHKVEFTHEMTASISQFSRGLDFGNLSAGQRARVNIALSFAFRDVLEHLHTRINICMLDEVLDVGLDNIGVQMAARLLKRKARDEKLSLYIISHRDELDSAFDNKITVQLSKGFSYIKTGD